MKRSTLISTIAATGLALGVAAVPASAHVTGHQSPGQGNGASAGYGYGGGSFGGGYGGGTEVREVEGFVGTVTAIDTTTDQLTVTISSSLPAGTFTGSETFDVGASTLIFDAASQASILGKFSDVKVGDVITGGGVYEVTEQSETSTGNGYFGDYDNGIEAPGSATYTPLLNGADLQFLVDYPVAASTTASTPSKRARLVKEDKAKALKRAKALLGIKTTKKSTKK